MPRALITGITGQDGSLLAELLLGKDYEVHGVVRRCSRPVTDRLSAVIDHVTLHQGDLLDESSLRRIVAETAPDEVYNLAAQTFVGTSWEQPILTGEVTALGAARMLEAVRREAPDARYYQASSSEQFGSAPAPQSESTPFAPRSPYGVAKVFAHQITVNYRESYGMHASCGILFNHEAPGRRGLEFVTRKVSKAVAEIKLGLADRVTLGSLTPRRDWGHASDYVAAMWAMLQMHDPGDYVIATGETHSVGDFVATAFACAELNWRDYVKLEASLTRPAEIAELRGDAEKARRTFSWEPSHTFADLVSEMVDADLRLAGREAPLAA